MKEKTGVESPERAPHPAQVCAGVSPAAECGSVRAFHFSSAAPAGPAQQRIVPSADTPRGFRSLRPRPGRRWSAAAAAVALDRPPSVARWRFEKHG